MDALYIDGGVGEPATAYAGAERGVQGTKYGAPLELCGRTTVWRVTVSHEHSSNESTYAGRCLFGINAGGHAH